VLVQSILSYCIPAWGGASTTNIIKLERAQRSVMTLKPFRYPTEKLYQDCEVLTIRQLFILQAILRKHSSLCYDTSLMASKRRSDKICEIPIYHTTLFRRHLEVLSSHLYNKINKKLNIYSKTRHECELITHKFLLKMNYAATESLLQIQQ
jgi:hypothetical protein